MWQALFCITKIQNEITLDYLTYDLFIIFVVLIKWIAMITEA